MGLLVDYFFDKAISQPNAAQCPPPDPSAVACEWSLLSILSMQSIVFCFLCQVFAMDGYKFVGHALLATFILSLHQNEVCLAVLDTDILSRLLVERSFILSVH